MEPTRITETTSNTLDLFYTSNKTLINKVEILLGITDYEAVFIESSLRSMKVSGTIYTDSIIPNRQDSTGAG